MGLEINTQLAKVGINKTDAFLSIKSPMPRFKTRTKAIEAHMEIENAQVIIDQKQCFGEIGHKTPEMFAQYNAYRSRLKGSRAIDDIVKKGDILARVDKNPRAIQRLAKGAMGKRQDYTVDSVPKSRPEVSIDGGTMNINWDMGRVELEAVIKRPNISATKASIGIYLLQKPYIDITYKGEGFDKVI